MNITYWEKTEMDIFWLYAAGIAAAVVILAGIPYNCIKAKGTEKKVILTGNGIMIGVIVFVLLFMFVSGIVRHRYDRDCESYNGGFSGSITYIGTEENYYILYNSLFVRQDLIAVPVSDCDMPFALSPEQDITVYYDKGDPMYSTGSQESIGGHECFISHNVRAIFPDHSSFIVIVFLIDIPLIVLFNVICFFMVREKASR